VYRISFHRLAERELNDAALYYERENRGLGVKFLDEIDRYIEAILKPPNAGHSIRGPVRRRILRKFPYGILRGSRQLKGRKAALVLVAVEKRPEIAGGQMR
jgi:toxin ParE1/3/4